MENGFAERFGGTIIKFTLVGFLLSFFIYVSDFNIKFIFQICFIFTVFETCLKPIKSLTYLLASDPNNLKRTPTTGDYISNIRWMTFNLNSPRWFNIIKTLIRCSTNLVQQPCKKHFSFDLHFFLQILQIHKWIFSKTIPT